MQKERKYGFRAELNEVHKPDRRDFSARRGGNEMEVRDGWKVLVDKNADAVTVNAARDLADYFFTSMNVSVGVKKVENVSNFAGRDESIVLATAAELGKSPARLTVPGSFALDASEKGLTICGQDSRGAAQGAYHVEDVMNLREAPFLPKGVSKREPVFSPRMVHSGWGIDQFPDNHLKAIAHSGINALLLFAKDVDLTTCGYLDFNELIERAGSFGLDVYIYSYLKSVHHPQDKGALEYYRATYGRMFKECPGAKGIVLVGESCEFPSHDTENTTGKPWNTPTDGIRQLKPSPGWWPCLDYPEWLEMLKKVIREQKKDAEIVFWTYNWGYAPKEARLKLIDALPKDVTLQVTFEMFEQIKKGGITAPTMDYTISYVGPGKYFSSEAEAAKKKNIKLYAMSNTGGMTWDFGTVPYIPAPFQWARRHKELHAAHEKWGLSGLMESHHYGIWPSEVSELAKWSFWTPAPSPEELLKKIAARDYGAGAARDVVSAWKNWSDAMNHYVPSNEDQYGPCRVGPSYPLVFHPDITRTFRPQAIDMPSVPHAHFGSRIVMTFYHPYENEQQSPGAMRYPVEIKELEKMLKKWQAGIDLVQKAAKSAPAKKARNFEKTLAHGMFIRNTIKTTITMKKWWLLNMELLNERNKAKAVKLLDKLVELAGAEIKNAEDTIPWVETHSRLGWEPSMEYMTDREHLEWKIRQVKTVVEYEIPTYKKLINL